MSAATILVSGVGYATVGRLDNQLSASELDIPAQDGSDSKPSKKKKHPQDGALDVLLVGSDSRTDAQGNPLSEAELARLHAGISDLSLIHI